MNEGEAQIHEYDDESHNVHTELKKLSSDSSESSSKFSIFSSFLKCHYKWTIMTLKNCIKLAVIKELKHVEREIIIVEVFWQF